MDVSSTDVDLDTGPSWDTLRGLVDAAGRPRAWTQTGHWALAVVADAVGDDWPRRAVGEHGRLPLPLETAGSHTLGLVALVELAMRLRLLDRAPGLGDLRAELAKDRRAARAVHTSLQLETAGLAVRH